ncbi:MAG: hypothetical protein HN352_08890 [Bacteroidetes bacterium]|jgi:4-amino-4-deoxychorismate lyase|nr:hypothetical protein [Bacteroidota bacterium]MBT3749651.1 hypothetical protein [Bacteroidota bacterium]MBT4400065.1 hypothetical protein [Bacteroidota bacterium]MBT4410145.1 hypothetical protein [Bacteroidota bacterium]MBT5425105.1 hypothetical protein [Bacteroidota bacterium]
MCRLLETIRVDNGTADNLEEHEERVTRAQEALFGVRSLRPLSELFHNNPPPDNRLYKWRILYEKSLISMEYQVHTRPNITSLQIVHLPDVNYHHKYADRDFLNSARLRVPSGAEPLLVINGHITDTTFTNLAFHTGSEWITPVKPLLAGTRRAALIKQKIIVTASIREENIFNYLTIRLFNALLPWEEAIELPISAIRI